MAGRSDYASQAALQTKVFIDAYDEYAYRDANSSAMMTATLTNVAFPQPTAGIELQRDAICR
jgi:hypothetical protein